MGYIPKWWRLFFEHHDNPIKGTQFSDKPIFQTVINRLDWWFHMEKKHLIGNNKNRPVHLCSSHRNPTWPSPVIRDPGPLKATCPWAAAASVCCNGLRSSWRRRFPWSGSWPRPRRCWDPEMPRRRMGWNTKPGALGGFWDVFLGCFSGDVFLGCFFGMFLGATVVFVWGMGENWWAVRFLEGKIDVCGFYFSGGVEVFFFIIEALDVWWSLGWRWDTHLMISQTIKQCIICGRDSRSWQWQGQNDDSSCWNMF